MTNAPTGFVVTTETGWDPPSRRASRIRWIGVILDVLSPGNYSATQDLSTGEPKWRLVVVGADGTRWAESAWRRDWPEVERLRAEWQERLATMPASDARSVLWKWSGA